MMTDGEKLRITKDAIRRLRLQGVEGAGRIRAGVRQRLCGERAA